MTDLRGELESSHFRTTVAKDLSRLAVGDLLGAGQFREVFEWLPDPSMVVKIEDRAKSFSNVHEELVWQRVRGTEFAKWFAPVHAISDNGTVLLMERTGPLLPRELPKQVPAFFTDLKLSNWGRLNGRVVCHDYGIHLLIEKGLTKRMRRADW